MAKRRIDTMIEQREGRPIQQILREMAIRRVSPEQAAADLGMSAATFKSTLYRQGGRVVRLIDMPDCKEDTNAAAADTQS